MFENFLKNIHLIYLNELEYFSQFPIIGIIFALSGVILLLYIFSMFKDRVYLFALITLPATFMHELMHFIISLITGGMPRGFSIFPKKSEEGYTLGYVESYNVTWYNGAFIGLAPLILLPIAYFFFKYQIVTETTISILVLKLYFLGTLIEGSMPSITDLELAIKKSLAFIWLLLIGFVIYITQS
jgi:hypothetical protein